MMSHVQCCGRAMFEGWQYYVLHHFIKSVSYTNQHVMVVQQIVNLYIMRKKQNATLKCMKFTPCKWFIQGNKHNRLLVRERDSLLSTGVLNRKGKIRWSFQDNKYIKILKVGFIGKPKEHMFSIWKCSVKQCYLFYG